MKSPEQLLAIPEMKAFLGQPSVQEGLELSRKHGDCPEYQELMEQAGNALIELAKAIKAHDQTCTDFCCGYSK